MALGSTQPLVKMSTRNISWGWRLLVHEADDLTIFVCRMPWKSGSLILLEPSGPHRACYRTSLPFYTYINHWKRNGDFHLKMTVMSFTFIGLCNLIQKQYDLSKCQDPPTHWHSVISKKARTVKDVLICVWQCCKLVMSSNMCTERCSMLTAQIHIDPHVQYEHKTIHCQ